MNKLEELLGEEKSKLDNLKAPKEMEDNLRSALDNIPRKRRVSFKGRIAALIILVLLLTYNIDTLAYYGRKLVGYENVMNGTLKELNQLGKGQSIGKSYVFDDGNKITVDEIMVDSNNMILFYTIYAPEGNIVEVDNNLGIISISSSLGRHLNQGGHGEFNKEGTEMRWVITADAPKFYEKNIKMSLNYTHENKEFEQGEIKFKIDRKLAVGKSVRMNINKNIEVNNRSIKVDSLVAAPTSTVVKGSIQNILQLGLDTINNNRTRPENIEMSLIADGKEIETLGSGMSTSMKGIKYNIRFDAIPDNTREIELRLIGFGSNEDADGYIDLNGEDWNIELLGEDIQIEDVYEKDGNTYVEFTTIDSTSLSKVYLEIDGKEVSLENTIPGNLDKVVQGEESLINYTRTMKFKGTGDDLNLIIKGIRFNKTYDQLIYSYNLNK